MKSLGGSARIVAAIIGVFAVLVLVISGASVFGDPGASAVAAKPGPVRTPIAEQHAYVDPNIGQEMNGKPGKVTLASKVKMHKPGVVSKDAVGNGNGTGCQKNYGDPGQCLPLFSQAQLDMPQMKHPWTCQDVRELFPQGISVTGKDTLGLDTNQDRTACGSGDG